METTDLTSLSEAELCFEIDKRESLNLMREAQIKNLEDGIKEDQGIITLLKNQLSLKKALA